MNLITYANSVHDLSLIKDSNCQEVIIGPKDLNRNSKLNLADTTELLVQAKKLGLRVTLEWDVLYTENQIYQAIDIFKTIDDSLIDCVRVQDEGVLEFVLTETNFQIQFIAETGNHNLLGLNKWVSYIGNRLDRLVISIELSKITLAEYIDKLDCDIEYLVLGKILLFYSPRKLLSPLLDGENEKVNYHADRLEAIGESEESPHKGFPLVENGHGTFMYHIKDLFLLDKLKELKELGLNYLRVDLRFEEDLSLLPKIAGLLSSTEVDPNTDSIKADYKNDLIRGYYQINKSDVLFKKLKNYRIQRKDSSYIGEVIEILKGEYLAINIKGQASLMTKDCSLKFITPEGKELFCKVHKLQDAALNDSESSDGHELMLMNYMSGVWPKSQVYLVNPL